jgi:hypothetical protein
MLIDRSNYEIWYLDWLDGNLNSLQVEELKLFLDQNPDLKEEFKDLTTLDLVSTGISFQYKELLKKTASDISQSQFEYLCAAYLENDLTNSQKAEMLETVNRYPDKKKTFDLIQKTILASERVVYKHKRLLLKRTTSQKVIRLSVTGISAAAAIALVIIVFPVQHSTTPFKLNSSARNFVSDSTLQKPSSVKSSYRIPTRSIPGIAEKKINNSNMDIHKKDNVISSYNMIAATDDSLVRKTDNLKLTINKVPFHLQVNVVKGIVSDTLIASNPTFNIPYTDDERSKVGKFISKNFREKLLKEKTPPDTPLKGYEIAEAGVTGLNKLFGWQMVLDMKSDLNGQDRSVYFSSKILKLNAPVKKREPQP